MSRRGTDGASTAPPRGDIAGARFTSAWDLQRAASSIFAPLRVRARVEEGFGATVRHAQAGPVAVTRISTAPATVLRDLRVMSSTDRDLLKVTLHGGGAMTVSQDGRHCRVRPGDLVAYETSRPYRLTGDSACDVVVIGIPRAMLGASADLISRRTAVAVPTDRGGRAVVAAMLSRVADEIDLTPGPARPHLADALVSLVTAAFAETTPERVDLPTDLGDRIVAYALANLSDPGLSAESVAARHGISTRYLYKVLQPRGIGFTAWVRRERLLRIRRDLLDPALAHQTIATVAARWGITEPAHLSRALRAEFGQSATQIRRMARASALPPVR